MEVTKNKQQSRKIKMPIVVNSNASATSASFNLSRANDSLRKSLERLSSGKRINNAGDDAGGLAVAYKLNSKQIEPQQSCKIHKMDFHFCKCKILDFRLRK